MVEQNILSASIPVNHISTLAITRRGGLCQERTRRETRKRNKERVSPRLRIYGNRYFLEVLTEVLSSQVEISPKRIQKATKQSESSGILYYQSCRELEKLLVYMYPSGIQYFHREYYEHFMSSLCNIGG